MKQRVVRDDAITTRRGDWWCPNCNTRFAGNGEALHRKDCPDKDAQYENCIEMVGPKSARYADASRYPGRVEIKGLDYWVPMKLQQYPEIFKTRKDVLYHIFIVNGSGYEWTESGSLAYHMSDLPQPAFETNPQPDVLSRAAYYPSIGLAAKIPENALPALRQACEEILADHRILEAQEKAKSDQLVFPQVALRQIGMLDDVFLAQNKDAAVWLLDHAADLEALWRQKHPKVPEDMPWGSRHAPHDERQKYNEWAERVRKQLPSLAERVFSLRSRFYTGCGFHYGLEKRLGATIQKLQDHDHATTNNDTLMGPMLFDMFLKDLERAELSAALHEALGNIRQEPGKYGIELVTLDKAKELAIAKFGRLPGKSDHFEVASVPFLVEVLVGTDKVLHECLYRVFLFKDGELTLQEMWDENIPRE